MKLLPYHRFEIASPLRREDAFAAIAAHVEPVNWFRVTWPNAANDSRFEGETTSDGFRIRRILGYRNSFTPVISGEIHAAGAMSRVVITMRPFLVVILLFGIWCAGLLATLAIAAAHAWIALPILVFVYGMVMGGFWFEATKQERALRTIFKAL